MPFRFLRGLGGRTLPCGCLIGIYETYGGMVIKSIDEPSASCRAGHRKHDALDSEFEPTDSTDLDASSH